MSTIMFHSSTAISLIESLTVKVIAGNMVTIFLYFKNNANHYVILSGYRYMEC